MRLKISSLEAGYAYTETIEDKVYSEMFQSPISEDFHQLRSN